VSGQLHAPAALPPGKSPGTHFTGGWVYPRAGLDDKHIKYEAGEELAKAMGLWNTLVDCFSRNFAKVLQAGPMTVATRSEAWNVFARSNTEIVDSNLTEGMDVCLRLFCLCCQRRADPPSKESYLTVYRIKKPKKRPRSNKKIVEP
jgi:hypothetical protein